MRIGRILAAAAAVVSAVQAGDVFKLRQHEHRLQRFEQVNGTSTAASVAEHGTAAWETVSWAPATEEAGWLRAGKGQALTVTLSRSKAPAPVEPTEATVDTPEITDVPAEDADEDAPTEEKGWSGPTSEQREGILVLGLCFVSAAAVLVAAG